MGEAKRRRELGLPPKGTQPGQPRGTRAWTTRVVQVIGIGPVHCDVDGSYYHAGRNGGRGARIRKPELVGQIEATLRREETQKREREWATRRVAAALLPADAPTYWNGEPATCRRVRVRVGHAPAATWWCAEMEGQERRAIEVTYGDQVFFLDDEEGDGWAKVTLGRGGPQSPHRSLPDDSAVVDESDAALPTRPNELPDGSRCLDPRHMRGEPCPSCAAREDERDNSARVVG